MAVFSDKSALLTTTKMPSMFASLACFEVL